MGYAAPLMSLRIELRLSGQPDHACRRIENLL